MGVVAQWLVHWLPVTDPEFDSWAEAGLSLSHLSTVYVIQPVYPHSSW